MKHQDANTVLFVIDPDNGPRIEFCIVCPPSYKILQDELNKHYLTGKFNKDSYKILSSLLRTLYDTGVISHG